ncbi:MAG TPA: aldo/keto reductase [Planctomycetota bacterium]|jgi:aryl-alcohol dehydrogenase-like predicted oxidoreductase
MRTRQLGYTDLELTTVGFGTFAAGGEGWQFSWGPQDDRETIAAIARAVENGVNWIDTAAVYGLGHAEEVVAKALKEIKAPVIVATKCGRREGPDKKLVGDLDPKFLRKECENSLRRLGLERIDLYQVHWPLPDEGIEAGWAEIAKLVKEGKVRYAGVSNFSVAQLKRAQAIHPVASSQPLYNMMRRQIEGEHLPFCKQNQIGVVAYSPLLNGLLTGAFSKERIAKLPPTDFRTRAAQFQEPEVSRTLAAVEKLKAIAAQAGLTCSQLAIAWILRREEVTSAIVGARKPAQIDETARAGDVVLGEDVLREIEGVLQEWARN